MIMRILVMLGLLVLGGGFIFFAANVIWLGTKEFFKVYGPKAKNLSKPSAPVALASASVSDSAAP